jgi:hypothetical protein
MVEDYILIMNYGYVIGLDQIGKHDIKIALTREQILVK